MTFPKVLITGASSGIGESCARYLATKGFCVYAGVRTAEAEQALLSQSINLQQQGQLIPVRLDVTQPEHWQQLYQRLEQDGQGLFALINNAGTGFGGPIEHLELQAFRDQFDVNFFAVIQGIQTCLPLLRQTKGRIINISSVNGRIVTPFLSPYCSSKFALEALTESLRYELAPWGMSVSLIAPGMIRTPIFTKSQARFQALKTVLTPQAQQNYAAPLAAFERVLAKAPNKGAEPQLVALAVEQALRDPSPRMRYAVGTDAKIALTLRKLLPEWAFEALIKRLAAGQR